MTVWPGGTQQETGREVGDGVGEKAAQSILIHFQQRHCDMEFPGGSVVRTAFSLPRAWAQSLVRELRSHKLSGTAAHTTKDCDK